MGIGGEASFGGQFSSEVDQVFLGEASFQICPGVHSWGRVSLEVDLIAIVTTFTATADEVIDGHFAQGSRRGEC